MRVLPLAAALLAATTALADPAPPELPCPSAEVTPPAALHVDGATLRRSRRAARSGGLDVVISPGDTLAANPDALAAAERAAARWEAVFTDPVTVTVLVDMVDLGTSGIVGAAASVRLVGAWDEVRGALVADAGLDELILGALPTLAEAVVTVPSGYTVDSEILATKANFKALGFTGLDADFGTPDASLTFNTRFPFDFDASDGVAPGTMDFEGVVVHEIGHALGFLSNVDRVNTTTPPQIVAPSTLDLLRFPAVALPPDATAFTTTARTLVPGVASDTTDTVLAAGMSTGVTAPGDGRQASHWKDDQLTGTSLGVMDPTVRTGDALAISEGDVRALDLVGWDAVTGDPGTTTSTTTTTTTTTSTSTTTTRPPPCAATPATDCRVTTSRAAALELRRHARPSRDRLEWTWARGDATPRSAFRDPRDPGTTVHLCTYAGGALVQDTVVPGGDGWRPTGAGFVREAPTGVRWLVLEAVDACTARIVVQGRGADAGVPPLPLAGPVTVQLVVADAAGSSCWQATYADARVDRAATYKARGTRRGPAACP